MKVALSLIVAGVSASETGAANNAIAKLLDTLTACEAKVTKEGEDAQKVYAEFAEWCEDRSKDLRYEVKTSKRQIAGLQATISKETGSQQALTSSVEDVAANIAEDDADLTAATKIRNQENADFTAREKDLVDVIDTIGRAINIIEREMSKGGAAMMQLKSAKSLAEVFKVMVQSTTLATADAKRLTAFVQSQSGDGDDDMAFGAPSAAVYENQSGGIFDVLSGLRDQSNEELDKIRKAERSAHQNYQMLRQSLQDEIKFANKEMSDAKKARSASEESQAAAQGDLKVTQDDLAQDTSTLADLHHECMSKSSEFETEAKSRAEEMRGLALAKGAISKIQLRESGQYDFRGASFLQIDVKEEPARAAVHMIRSLARKKKDPVLQQLASRMAFTVKEGSKAGMDDVFAALKQQILESIKQIEAEEAEDATKKVYCDKELAENEAKVQSNTDEIEKHTAKIDKNTAASSRTKEEVATLEQELATMTKEKFVMDNLRQKEKADYDFNKAETTQSIEEIRYALKVLRDFYGSYVKEHSGFSSQDGAAQGVIAMLRLWSPSTRRVL
jgi:hypothetical protein